MLQWACICKDCTIQRLKFENFELQDRVRILEEELHEIKEQELLNFDIERELRERWE